MAQARLTDMTLDQLEALAPQLAALPFKEILVQYDAEADSLYLGFRRPPEATNSEDLDNGIIVDYRGDEVVGVEILDASKRTAPKRKKTRAPA